jgi:hypothetical protein
VSKEMAARTVWWISSLTSVANDQLIDRQYQLDIDDGGELNEVSDFIKNSRAKKEALSCEDEDIQVARCILSRIKDHKPFHVVIPCAEKAEWKLKRDHRTQKKFWDLVEGFANLGTNSDIRMMTVGCMLLKKTFTMQKNYS